MIMAYLLAAALIEGADRGVQLGDGWRHVARSFDSVWSGYRRSVTVRGVEVGYEGDPKVVIRTTAANGAEEKTVLKSRLNVQGQTARQGARGGRGVAAEPSGDAQ